VCIAEVDGCWPPDAPREPSSQGRLGLWSALRSKPRNDGAMAKTQEEDMEKQMDGRPPWRHLLPLLILATTGIVCSSV
jgi:hypothetical protein